VSVRTGKIEDGTPAGLDVVTLFGNEAKRRNNVFRREVAAFLYPARCYFSCYVRIKEVGVF
jgi:hypothetical protein